MKRILFSSAAAICSVAGLSSFRSAHAFQTLYYFQINLGNCINLGATVTPSQVTYIGNSDPGGAVCPPAILFPKKCIIAVTVAKVTAVHKTHLSRSVTNGTIYTHSCS